ncbi:hypothetical protein HT031_002854 [Scenedesmus sp. PABB004]|nr:hypothetical protein HT031_002854 [Scenedesmus sp. PABB004]
MQQRRQPQQRQQQQQAGDWRAVRRLPLAALASGALPAVTPSSSARRRDAPRCAAAARQRGAAYYENYLRNRRARGGELLGPPEGPALLAADAGGAPEQQEQEQSDGPADAPGPASAFSPRGFAALLEQCRLATAPGPAAAAAAAEGRGGAPPPLAPPPQQGARALDAASSPQQAPREDWQFKDHLPPELADAVLPALKPRRGLTLGPPDLAPPPVAQRVALPPLPAPPPGRVRLLHMFWDLGSAHPGGLDPRAVVSRLRAALAGYGEVAGMYAYGLQKMLSWVPEAFMLQYAPERLPGRRGAQGPEARRAQAALGAQLAALEAAGVDVGAALGPLRCPACGKLRDSHAQLHLHMVQRHKQPAPPLERLLPAGAAAAALAAAGLVGPAPGAAAGGGSAARGARAAPRGDPAALRNSSTRTLGRVSRYTNSRGAVFVPPDGHQISLKYVLLREGVEVRLVQRQSRAIDAALADGAARLLRQLAARDAAGAQRFADVLVVVSDRGAHAGAVAAFRRAGLPVLAVCQSLRSYPGADATLRWQWLVAGRYGDGTCGGGGGAAEPGLELEPGGGGAAGPRGEAARGEAGGAARV